MVIKKLRDQIFLDLGKVSVTAIEPVDEVCNARKILFDCADGIAISSQVLLIGIWIQTGRSDSGSL
jgi:hypothetical protein